MGDRECPHQPKSFIGGIGSVRGRLFPSPARSRSSLAPRAASASRPLASCTPAALRSRSSTSTRRRPRMRARPIGERTLAIAADVTDAEAMEAAVATVVERFGGLDILVANAGVAPTQRPMLTVDADACERVARDRPARRLAHRQPALDQIIARRGHVVVVASVYAFVNGVMASPYATAKAGVEQIGRALRTELSRPRRERQRCLLRLHRHRHGPRCVRAARRPARRGDVPRLRHQAAASRRSRAPRSSTGSSHARRMIIRPRWWRIYSVLRGIVNPLLDRAPSATTACATRSSKTRRSRANPAPLRPAATANNRRGSATARPDRGKDAVGEVCSAHEPAKTQPANSGGR